MNDGEFEKQFPDFEDWDDLINWDEDSRGYDKGDIINAIQYSCISKQRVRGVIDKLRKKKHNDECFELAYHAALLAMEDELGVD